MIKRGILVFPLCIFLISCAGPANVLPTPVVTQIPEKLTTEIKAPANALATLIPSSTFTGQPTRKPTSAPRVSDTPAIVQPTITDSFPPKNTSTQIASFPAACDHSILHKKSLSPKGNWLAVTCGENWSLTLKIISKAGEQWQILYKNYLPPNMSGDRPSGQLDLVYWTSDEAYLYITSHIGFDGGGTCLYQQGDSGLYRLNLKTGALSATLPWREPEQGYEIAFSPDGSKLAYYADRPTILDLQTGAKTVFYPGDRVVGDMIWSPDGKKLAYSTCQITQNGVGKSSIQIYSLDRNVPKTIYETDDVMLRIDLRNGNTQLKISGRNDRTDEIGSLFFDWPTELLIEATLTPTP